jgi:serine/threonine-protein kinase
MNPAPDPTPGTPEQFGPYELHERLGIGGMATVFRAKKRGPEGFERTVALKRMLQHLAEDSSFVEGFIREAKVASMLAHPNIAQVYDFGRIQGVYYIAMELVAGFDLRRLLRYASRANEPIALPVVFSILGELCDALEYAHTFVGEDGQQNRIVHRDISPSNLIISPTGHLKVIDFGIAKASTSHLRTETGMVKGKLGYMAPEVALGMSVGPGADVFSMGVVAWELITASPLFTARTDFETMRKLREGQIDPPSSLNPLCPAELDQIVLQAIHREADQRMPSAGMFRRLLDGIAARYGVPVSARAVIDWMARMPQTAEGYRGSVPSQPMPIEPATAMLRPSQGTKLRRSNEVVQLATDIWGEDAKTSASDQQPDFDAASVATMGSHAFPLQAPPRTQMRPPSMPVMPGPALRVAQPKKKRWPFVVIPLLMIVVGALAGYLVSRGGDDQLAAVTPTPTPTPPAPLPPTPTPTPAAGTLRFAIEPANAVIEVGGKEVGRQSPLDVDLAPGVYTVSIHQDGYKSWSNTVTLAAGAKTPVDVALERLDTVAVANPLLNPKDHRKKHIPTTSVDKAHVYAVHPGDAAHVAPDPEPEPLKVDPTPPKIDPVPTLKPDAGVTAPPPPTGPARVPTVGMGVVAKLSGDLPAIKADGESGDVLAKLCVDESGVVTSTKIVKAPAGVGDALGHAFDSWRYKPYLDPTTGKISRVCFPVSMHVVVKRPD